MKFFEPKDFKGIEVFIDLIKESPERIELFKQKAYENMSQFANEKLIKTNATIYIKGKK